MSPQFFSAGLDSPEATIRVLQEELEQTNREVLALTVELEKRVQERTAALRQAQQDLERQNTRLQAANKELEAFSYSVSHDLRAPLRHIEGFTQALAEDCQETLGTAGREYLRLITSATQRMSLLIDHLLSFARTAQQRLQPSDVDLNDLVRGVIAEYQPDQAARKIEWNVKPLPVVRGDSALLRQVWRNLIGNAIKYTRQKDPARIEIGWRGDPDGQLVFHVRDNGAGFDMKFSEKLFGLFQRLHATQEFEGTGLGLAIVRRIIERHGGRTWGEGRPGEGATFYFSLPDERLNERH